MNIVGFSRASLAALFVVGAFGCAGCGPGTGTPDGGEPPTCSDGSEVCKKNIDCAQGAVCEKANEADETGCCHKVLCTSDADCDEGEVCDIRRGICVPEGLCDPANPEADCAAGQVCTYVGGAPQCLDISEIPAPDACVVAPAKIYVRAGGVTQVQAVGRTTAGALVPFATFTFTSTVGTISNGALTAADCTSPNGDGVCTGTVTATADADTNVHCDAAVTVYPALTTGSRITLFDQTTGLPIANAKAAVKETGNATLVETTTNAAGSATFTTALANIEAISVFPTGHQWHTVLSPSTDDIVIYTVPVPDSDVVTGVKGEINFDNVHTNGDIKLGLVGTAISSAVTDLNFTNLIGEIADYPVELEGVTDGEQLVPLPSGLVLELGAEPIKGNFVVFGDEETTILWALGGKVRLAEIGPIISSVTADTNDINVGSILAAVLPFFARFDHAVVTGLDLPAAAQRPTPPGEDQPVPYGDWDFPELTGANKVPLDTLLSQSAPYKMPSLPCSPGAGTTPTCSAYNSGAVILAGVIVPGQGIVPLGLTAGLDDPDTDDTDDQADGKIDWDPEVTTNPPPSGEVILDYAPPHDGLEGNLFITVALALDIDNIVEGAFGTSILTHVTERYEDLDSADKNEMPLPFLDSQGGSYTASTRTFVLEPVGDDAQFYRVNLDDGGDAEWNIWFDDPSLGDSIAVDTYRPGTVTGRDVHADIQAFRLGSGYETIANTVAPTSFHELFDFDGTNLNNLLYYLGAWVSTPCEAATTDFTPFCEAL